MAAAGVVALFGPTAVGKTAVAVALACRMRARGQDPVAVSADALQVYTGLELITGAADARDQAELEHRLVSCLPVTASFSVAEYARLAHAEIDALIGAGRPAIVVGGSGLYLRAALANLDLRPPPRPEVRERWQRRLAARGATALHEELAAQAPRTAADIDPRDGRRVVRALELLEAGEPPPDTGDSQLWTAEMRHPTLLVGLTMERGSLYERVEARVDAMVAAGAADQVRRADAAGASATARQALGFDDLLAGDVDTLKRATRRYAKRQLTWMRKLAGVRIIDVTGRSPDEVANEIDGLTRASTGN